MTAQSHRTFIKSSVPIGFSLEESRGLTPTLYTSFANPNFYGRRLHSILHFLNEHFDQVMIVTPGYLYRHSYFSLDSVSEDIRAALALSYERKYVQNELSQHSKLLGLKKFAYISWSEYCFSEKFHLLRGELNECYQMSGTFKDKIDEAVCDFLYKRSKTIKTRRGWFGSNQQDWLRNKQSSIEFVLDELAFFACAVDKGHPLIMYPSKLFPLLEDIINGKHPEVPSQLEKVVFICYESIKIKGKKRQKSKELV